MEGDGDDPHAAELDGGCDSAGTYNHSSIEAPVDPEVHKDGLSDVGSDRSARHRETRIVTQHTLLLDFCD